MKVRQRSSMAFWIRSIIFAAILIGLAVYLLANPELWETLNNSVSSSSSNGQTSTSSTSETKKLSAPAPVSKKSTNKAAEGLSNFYANLHGDMDAENGPRVRNNIVYLPDPKGDLEELLEARRLVTRPLRKTWQGSKENRPFRTGFTLHQKLAEYANADGLEVIWWLNRDFIIKDPFRIDHDIIQTAYRVGKAVEGHFQNGLSTYFCYQHRAIVLIEEAVPYLDEECKLLDGTKSSRYR